MKGIIIANIGGFLWGIILGIVFTSFKQPIFTSWQYWTLLIYPVVIFTIAGNNLGG